MRLHKLEGHKDAIQAGAFAPNGETAVSADHKGLVIVWDLKTGKPLQRIRMGVYFSFEWAISPYADLVACGDSGGVVKVLNLATTKVKAISTIHSRPISAVAFSPNGELLASAGYDTVHIWNRVKKKTVLELRSKVEAAFAEVKGLGFIDDDRHIVLGGSAVEMFDRRSGKRVKTISGWGDRGPVGYSNSGQVGFLISAKEMLCYSTEGSKTIHLWRNRTIVPHWSGAPYKEVNLGFYSAAFSKASSRVLLGSSGCALLCKLGFMFGLSLVKEIEGAGEGLIGAVALSAKGDLALTGGDNGSLSLWQV